MSLNILLIKKNSSLLKFLPNFLYQFTRQNRLHFYYPFGNIGIPGQTYKVASKTSNIIFLEEDDTVKFPDIYCLSFFHRTPKWSLDISISGERDSIMIDRSHEYTRVIRRIKREQTLNFGYFSDLPPGKYSVHNFGDGDVTGFCNGDKGALIMPMKIREEAI